VPLFRPAPPCSPSAFPSSPRRARSPLVLVATLLLATVFAGCEPAQSSPGGDSTMILGLFSKSKKNASTVHADVGAPLVKQAAFPATLDAPPQASYGQAVDVEIDGTPPQASFVTQHIDGRTTSGHRIPAAAGQPPVVVANLIKDGIPSAEIWELDASGTRFAKRRLDQFDPAQSKWVGYETNGATALPAHKVLVGLRYTNPRAVVGFYLYDRVANDVRPLGVVEPDWTKGVPFIYADTHQVGPDAALVLFHTDKLLLGAERYANGFDHLMLFSPRHPQGLEVLKLGIDDGNVLRWGLVGKTLWLQTADPRGRGTPVSFTWSLDLSRVL